MVFTTPKMLKIDLEHAKVMNMNVLRTIESYEMNFFKQDATYTSNILYTYICVLKEEQPQVSIELENLQSQVPNGVLLRLKNEHKVEQKTIFSTKVFTYFM